MSKPSISLNPWPFALVGVFAIFITLVAMFITFAVAQDIELVRSDYYAAELRYQEQIHRLERTAALGDQVEIAYLAGQQVIQLTLPPSHARVQGRVTFYRPSDARLDHEIALALDDAGRQLIPVASLRGGLWKVQVHWTHQEEEYFANTSVVLAGPTP